MGEGSFAFHPMGDGAHSAIADIGTVSEKGQMDSIVNAVRWEPTRPMPELPLAVFDLAWSASGELTCVGKYPDYLNPPAEGIIIKFNGVHAFMSFDEYSDVLDAMRVRVPALATPVPYGGCWPFAEIVGSPWTTEVTGRDGTIDPTNYRHWVVLTMNQALHVMAHVNSMPEFVEWVAR